MIETGIDIIEINRIEDSIKNSEFVRKYFHPKEIAYSEAKQNSAQHFAVRFAAKEAVRKILLSHIDKLRWSDSWIENDKTGKPILHFSTAINQKIKIHHSSVSLSHTKDTAIAIVIMDVTSH